MMSLQISINQNLIEMEYAVRGPLPQRAAELRQQGKFIIPCNIGNPQALGQPPISFYRQVLSLLENPDKIDREYKLKSIDSNIFKDINGCDFISDYTLEYCEEFISKMETGMGAYTESKGPKFIRDAVANFIDQRDSITSSVREVPSDPENIFLTDGASEGVKNIIELLITSENDGIMIPIPQYPLYSATIKRCGGKQVNYYPDEDSGWTLNKSILEEAVIKAKKKKIKLKAIVVINPANPTGAILDKNSIQEVVAFARENELAIIADEVYQENLYGAEFISFAKAIGKEDIPLFSLHSVSKGYYGECGHRGGYLEVRNPPKIKGSGERFIDVLFKQASVNLCSNTVGQALIYMLVNPPKEGTETYRQFTQEKQAILVDLYDKATLIKEAFKEMDSVECFGKIGALYLFPRLNKLSPGTDDFDYCMNLLEETGLSTVNGAGFGQMEGTNHLRIAFLPSKKQLLQVLPKWIEFHNAYVNKK